MKGSYLKLAASGELQRRIDKAFEILKYCTLCPRSCGVNRLQGEEGYCRTTEMAEVASYGPHFGEERCLVGSSGSGTIFFCGCNLLCRFCQNYSLSQATDPGCTKASASTLATVMVQLQDKGCHNINFVTPTHVVPQILVALQRAVDDGLHIPLVYNCGGYEEVATLELLDGVVDIYMPDSKFWNPDSAKRHANCEDYPEKMQAALVEMQRQVGDLQFDTNGIATSGLMVRHLLMPGALGETESIVTFLAETISKECYLNLMDQYRPCGEYIGSPVENGTGDGATISGDMHGKAVEIAKKAGLRRLDEKDFTMLLANLMKQKH